MTETAFRPEFVGTIALFAVMGWLFFALAVWGWWSTLTEIGRLTRA